MSSWKYAQLCSSHRIKIKIWKINQKCLREKTIHKRWKSKISSLEKT